MGPELRALIDGSRDAMRRVIADVREKADAAEQLRAAEHRAFMAEQREAIGLLTRRVDDKLASVRDGVDGRDGNQGPVGPQGEVGPRGERGDAGPAGLDGRDGADGAEGPAGPKGESGPQGAAGETGQPGKAGETGPQGGRGERGETGPQGDRGDAGAQGERGEAGETGPQGAAGPQGERGERGVIGDTGPAGADGRDAYPGEARGLFDPAAAYRAMDVVSFNGSEWRAKRDDPGELPGDGWMLSASRGKRGDRGERGAEGARGKDGAAIVAAYVDNQELRLTLTRDDGSEVSADLYGFAQVVRSAAGQDAGAQRGG